MSNPSSKSELLSLLAKLYPDVDLEAHAEDELAAFIPQLKSTLEARRTPPMQEIMQVVARYADLDFSAKANVDSGNPVLNKLAQGINQLGDKIESSTIGKEYVDNILRSMVGLVIVIDLRGSIQMVNDEVIRKLGYSEEELVGKHIGMIIEELEDGSFKKRNEAKFQLKKEYRVVCHLKNGETIPIAFAAAPMPRHPGKPPSLVCLAHDLSEIKDAEQKLQQSEYLYRNLMQETPDGVLYVNRDRKIEYVNPSFCKLTGYNEEELIGADPIPLLVYPHDVPAMERREEERLQGAAESYELAIRRKDGERVWFRINATMLRDERGEAIGSMGINTDITEQKKSEAKLRDSLREKEILIKEVHHRVKNNLQIISSLLNLQRNTVENKLANEILKESQNRIKSMSVIHEKLYQSENLASIDFAGYVEQIVDQLLYSYGLENGPIEVSLAVKDVYLGVDLAVPCGLVLNELVSNALKYAFDDTQSGTLSVSFGERLDGMFELVVKDNGKGLPVDFDWINAPSLGLQLVITLVEQLEGDIQLSIDDGTEFTITFSDPT